MPAATAIYPTSCKPHRRDSSLHHPSAQKRARARDPGFAQSDMANTVSVIPGRIIASRAPACGNNAAGLRPLPPRRLLNPSALRRADALGRPEADRPCPDKIASITTIRQIVTRRDCARGRRTKSNSTITAAAKSSGIHSGDMISGQSFLFFYLWSFMCGFYPWPIFSAIFKCRK